MSSGTKIALAIITLFVSVLVLYYGFIMPTPEPVRVAGQGEAGVPRDPTVPASADEDASEDGERTDGRKDRAAAAAADARTTTPPTPVIARDEAEVSPVTIPPAEAARLHAASDALTGTGGGSTHLPAMRIAEQPADPGGTPARTSGQISGQTSAGTDADPGSEASPANADPAGGDDPAGTPARAETTREVAPPPGSGPTAPAAPRYTSYVVQEGDTMSSIAARWFGDERKWELIAKANLVDPNRLRIGQLLRLPPKDAIREPVRRRTGASARTYTVRAGDSLSSIAAALYDDPARWRDIYDANRRLIGASPDDLLVGMELTIPPAGSGSGG